VDCEICAACLGCSRKVVVFGGVLKRGDIIGKTVFTGVMLAAGVG
jgi:hypothetical protein